MPGWIDATTSNRIATRLGVDPASAEYQDALTEAQRIVEETTGLVLGALATRDHPVILATPMAAVPVPADTQAVVSVTPSPPATPTLRGGVVWLLDDSGQPVNWPEGRWVLSLSRGMVSIPQRIIDAVALIVAHQLRPPDPARSRYPGGVRGGGVARSATGVPEAEDLLAPYLGRVGVRAL